MSDRKYIVEFNRGQRGLTFKVDERGEALTPYEKGAARRAYQWGRVIGQTDDIRGCVKYMRRADVEKLNERLAALYLQTLTDMYGEEEAKAFIERRTSKE